MEKVVLSLFKLSHPKNIIILHGWLVCRDRKICPEGQSSASRGIHNLSFQMYLKQKCEYKRIRYKVKR